MAAERVPQEQNHVHFELHVDDRDGNQDQHGGDDTESQGKVTRTKRSSCEEVQERDGF